MRMLWRQIFSCFHSFSKHEMVNEIDLLIYTTLLSFTLKPRPERQDDLLRITVAPQDQQRESLPVLPSFITTRAM